MEQSKFILEVQSRQCLWNPKIESYYDRFKKRRAWEEVAAVLCRGFQNFSDDEKREAVQELQRNWKSLKDYHKRRNPSEDIDEKTKRPKPIIELLQFLDKVSKFELEAKQSMPQSVNLRGRSKKKNLLLYTKEEDLSFTIEAQQSLDPKNMKHESNINFLQSILPEMQSLNDRQRFEFKLGVMRLIKRIRYNGDENTASAAMDVEIIPNHENCELIKSFECFPRSVSPLLLSVNRCNGQTLPNINDSEIDMTSSNTKDIKAQDFCKS